MPTVLPGSLSSLPGAARVNMRPPRRALLLTTQVSSVRRDSSLLRACFKNRMAPVFVKKAGWLGATSRAYPLRSVRDVVTTPDGRFRENSPPSGVFRVFNGSPKIALGTGALIVLGQALRH